jgi:hypothetical protein
MFLDDGNTGERRLDAEIAAGDHNPVGGIEDLVEVVQRRLGLDLRDHGHVAAEALDVGPGGPHVLGRADERQPEVVDPLLQADAQVT